MNTFVNYYKATNNQNKSYLKCNNLLTPDIDIKLSRTQFFSSSERALYQDVTWSSHAGNCSLGAPIMIKFDRQEARDIAEPTTSFML